MKSFLLTLAILMLLLCLIIWNTAYMNKICRALLDEGQNIPDCKSGKEALNTLATAWEQELVFIELSVSRRETEKISEYLAEWQSAAETGDEHGFERCRALFCTAVSELLERENGALKNWV